jgi:hypothetical protein
MASCSSDGFIGKLALSRSHLETAVALYDLASHDRVIQKATDPLTCIHWLFWGIPSFVSVLLIRHRRKATQQSPKPGGCVTRHLWLGAWRSA